MVQPGCGGGSSHSNPGSLTKIVATGTFARSLIVFDASSGRAEPEIQIPQISSGGASLQPRVTSLLIPRGGTRGFVGTDAGVFPLDLGTVSLGSLMSSAPGTILASSPDGISLVVADHAVNFKTYILNTTTGASQPLPISDAQSAVYSGDGSRVFLTQSKTFYAFDNTGAIGSASLYDIGFSITNDLTGTVAMVASRAGFEPILTCNVSNAGVVSSSPNPQVIGRVPGTNKFLAAGGSGFFSLSLTVSTTNCPQSLSPTLANLGQGPLNPGQLVITPDGLNAFVTFIPDPAGDFGFSPGTPKPAGVMAFNVQTGAKSPIYLSGPDGAAYAGVASLDNKYVFVTGATNLHRIDTHSWSDMVIGTLALDDGLGHPIQLNLLQLYSH